MGAAAGLLRAFNDDRACSPRPTSTSPPAWSALAGETDEAVPLAVALAVRAPRLGHVFVDLATMRDTASVESDEPVDLSALPWPDSGRGCARCAASELVAAGERGRTAERPLRLLGTRLYLDRYWREERQVAADLRALAAEARERSKRTGSPAGLDRLFPDDADRRQRMPRPPPSRRRLAVVAGGPGTGKTTTVARIVALLAEQAAAAGRAHRRWSRWPRPRARRRRGCRRRSTRRRRGWPVDADVRELLLGLRASTLHRLLGWRPGSHSRFRHDRGNRLPHDVVIVDETSMVSLSLMARLRRGGPPRRAADPGRRPRASWRRSRPAPCSATSSARPMRAPEATSRMGIVVLDRVHRYGGAIARVAEAVRSGDGDATIAALRAAPGEVTWLRGRRRSSPTSSSCASSPWRRGVAVTRRAAPARRSEALTALSRFRLLCAHRRGPYGVATGRRGCEGWLAGELADLDVEQRDYVGRPLLVTENDYELGLYNGDTGVIVQGASGRPSAVFERGGETARLQPARGSARSRPCTR